MIKTIIHIGLHKTATTLIQSILYNNKSVLTLANINYINWDTHTEYQQIDDKILPNKLNFISCENFFPVPWLYQEMDSFEKALKTVKDKQDKLNLEIQFIVTLREQVSYIESIYLQKIKTGKTTKTFEEFIQDDIQIYKMNYLNYIGKIKEFFPQTIVKHLWYETIFKKKDKINAEKYYIQKFLKLFCDISTDKLNLFHKKRYWRNINISKEDITDFLQINKKKERCELRKKIQNKAQINYYKGIICSELKKELQDKYNYSNQKLGFPIHDFKFKK